MSHSLDLLFLKPSIEKLSIGIKANIYVKTHTRDKEGNILITSYGQKGTVVVFQ